MSYRSVIEFWFHEIEPKQWWVKDIEFDGLITKRFQALHHSARQGELHAWRETPEGKLAEIIVLDQFSRNIYRNTPLAFANDNQALVMAQEAIRVKANQSLSPAQKPFMYMPFMHSESSVMHKVAVELFSEPGLESSLDFEFKHKAIIDRFGRYPHRNEILGRSSTEQEIEFLQQPGSAF